MKKIISIFFLLSATIAMAQDKGIIQGIVLDKDVNNEPLAFVDVSVKETQINTTTDLDGLHTLKVKTGVYTLVFNFPGYKKVEITNVIVKKDKITKVKNIALESLSLVFSTNNDTARKEESTLSKLK